MKTEKKFPEIKSADYPKETAVRRMVQEVPVAYVTETVGDVLKMLKSHLHTIRTVNYIYVIDEEFHLVGTFSVKHLFTRDPKDEVYTFARMKNIITVRPDTDQEKVAYLALKHNIKAIPVVGKKRLFLGVVPNDVILSIVYKETREDLLHLAGIEEEAGQEVQTLLETPIFTSFKQRLGWLVLGSIGYIFAAQFIGLFSGTLEEHILLTAFLPFVLFINTAVGFQIQTLTIRDFAMSEKLNITKYFLRHASVVLLIAMCFSAGLFLISLLYFGEMILAQVLFLSLLVGILSSLITGFLVPAFLRRAGSDPANSGGPLASGIQDLFSILIYFSIAALVL